MWLQFSDEPWPPLIQRCIASQKIPGYEHVTITMENYYKGSKYVNEAMAKAKSLYDAGEKKKAVTWIVKASDWLRCWHTNELGGIYLDADMEVLPGKNFDDLLDNRFFTENEVYGLTANAGFGSEAHHPFLTEYVRRVEDNFRGDGEMVFDPGIRAFADLMWITDKEKDGIVIYDTKMFFPYHHGSGAIDITPETKVYHHYTNTWCGDNKLVKLGTDYETKDFTEIFNKYNK